MAQVESGGLAGADCRRRCAFVCTAMSFAAREEQRKSIRAADAMDPVDLPDEPLWSAEPETRHLARTALQVLRPALNALSDENRLIIDLAIAGTSRRDIGEQVGLSRTAVTTRLQRIRDQLAEVIGPDVLTELDLRTDRRSSGGAN
jgi:RNA polymerase sigma factor (sigma-70 family)